MRKNKYMRVISALVLMLLCLTMAMPQETQAASYTGQETTINLFGTRVGRYKLNYTGNTNHYATWNTDGVPIGNVIYNDLGGGYANSSTAALNPMSKISTIKYAYLIWETRASAGATEPIILRRPDGRMGYIYPEYAINDWREDTVNGSWAYQSMFCMATDVTSIVQNAGYGNYSVCNIPRWAPTQLDSSGKYPAGESPGAWQLIIVEESDDFPVSAVKLDMGAKFYMGKDFGSSLLLGKGLKSKSVGNTTGQVFFGASNSSSNAAMTENVSAYNNGGGLIGQVVSNTTYSAGLYKNGGLINGRDYGNGCIRMDLSDVSSIGNNANRIDLTVQNANWTTSFLLGLSVEIAYPDFEGSQTTTVNSSTSVTVQGKFTNTAATQNTGIYNGHMTVTLDSGLTPVKATAVVNGKTTIYGTVSGNTVTFRGQEVASMMNGSTISYTVECTTANSGKTLFSNSAGFHGYLRADGVNTGYWIDRMWLAESDGVPKYRLDLLAGNGIGAVTGAGEYPYGSRVNIGAELKDGYHWKGWGGSPVAVKQKDSFTMPAGNLMMTAEGEANSYMIVFDPNGGGAVTPIDGITVKYDEQLTLPDASSSYIKYTLDGVNVTQQVLDGDIVLDDSGVVVLMLDEESGEMVTPGGTAGTKNTDGNAAQEAGVPGAEKAETDGIDITDAATDGTEAEKTVEESTTEAEETSQENPEASETEAVEENPEVSGTEADTPETASVVSKEVSRTATAAEEPQPAEVPEAAERTEEAEATEEPQPDKKAYASVYMGWSLADGKDDFQPQWKAGEAMDASTVIDAAGVTNQDGAVITLYAVWDDCPWIQAVNLYYTLEQAQSGFITEEEILSHATAFDREDGSPIAAGFHENGTSFSIPDYAPTDFNQFMHSGSSTENLTVVDSSGSVYCKMITVYVADTTPVAVKPEGTTRFIDEYYYNQPYENGGLEEDSVWKTDPEYVAAIKQTFENSRNDTPIATYTFTHEEILKMRDYVREHGIGNSKEEEALDNFYDLFMAPNLVE